MRGDWISKGGAAEMLKSPSRSSVTIVGADLAMAMSARIRVSTFVISSPLMPKLWTLYMMSDGVGESDAGPDTRSRWTRPETRIS
eukprot:8566878-Pyramimonas_sp.AAC.1